MLTVRLRELASHSVKLDSSFDKRIGKNAHPHVWKLVLPSSGAEEVIMHEEVVSMHVVIYLRAL